MGSTRKNDILQGTLSLLVLKSLAAQGRMHGYAITEYVQRVSSNLLRVEEGSLYPALHRMEQDGWLKSEWGTTDQNRDRKSTRLNSSHLGISYAVFCLKKKKKTNKTHSNTSNDAQSKT